MSSYYGPDKNDRRSILSWLFLAILIAFILVPVGFALDWFSAPTKVFGPDRMAAMSQKANDTYHALEAQHTNAVNLQQAANDMLVQYGEDRSKWPQGKADEYLELKQQQRNAMMAYNRSCSQYEAMWDDQWRELSLTGVDDLPKNCELMQ